MAHIGRSEKGIVNTEYKRYLARIPKSLAVAKLGYSEDVAEIGADARAPIDGAGQRTIRPGDPGAVGSLLAYQISKEVDAYGKTTFPLDSHHSGGGDWLDGDCSC